MTNPTQTETVEGWTEERIAAKVREVSHNDIPDMRTRSVTEFQAQQLMGLVWSDCQQQIAELRQQLDEAQAGWETVPDGYYGDLEVADDGATIGVYVDEDYGYAMMDMPSNLRLQQRKAGGDE